MSQKETTRRTITLPSTTDEAIEAYANRKGDNFTSAVQHLIAIGLTAEAIAHAGGEIVANLPSGEKRVLADKSGNYTHRTPLTKW